MSKYIAVVGMTLGFVNPAHSGTITVTGASSTKVKAGGQFVYQTSLTISITAGTDGSITNATGTGTITATATKVKAETKLVLRVDDLSDVITMTGTNPAPPPPTATYTTQVKITNAGQTKAKAE